MFKLAIRFAACATAIAIAAGSAYAANPKVGGAAMYEDKNIVENAMNSKDHTTLVAAVKAAGLVETLQGRGRLPCSPRRMKRSQLFPREPSTHS